MKRTILGAACTALLLAASGVANAMSVSGQGTWESTLQARDLDGNVATFEAYYDTALDITWLANPNYAGTPMTWAGANVWANGLTLGGYTEWRLPTTTDTGTSGCNSSNTGGTDCGYNVSTASSEMAHMFYSTLGNLAFYSTAGVANQPGWGLSNTGPFSSLQPSWYWSATEYAPSRSDAWHMYLGDGFQGHLDKTYIYYAWAVHTGDVGGSAIPEPATAWFFGSGLLGLVGLSRKRRR